MKQNTTRRQSPKQTPKQMSAQREKFLLGQSRKFLFGKREPMGIVTTTGADGIERKGTRSAESAA